MSDGEPEFRITAVRNPNLTDEEIRRRWKTVYDIILKLDPSELDQNQDAAAERAKPKPS